MDCTLLLHNLFEKQCERMPDKWALVFEQERVTYRELNEKANRVAEYFLSLGLPIETPVAVICEQNIDCIASILGILKAGCAYVPIDRNYPITRAESFVKQANIECMVTDSSSSILFGEAIDNLRVITPAHLLKRDERKLKDVETTPNNLAYVIYTSGSTGTPKAVMIEHQSVVQTLLNQTKFIDLQSSDRYFCFSSIAFDSSVCEIFGTLSVGATAYLYNRSKNLSPKMLQRYISENEITAATFTPSVLKLLTPAKVPTLQKVISAGEKCSVSLMRNWAQSVKFYNAYGPAEASVCTHMRLCHCDDTFMALGEPLTGNYHYVLDDNMEPVAPGEIGQLYLGGRGVARGYIMQNTGAFIQDPFSTDPSSRLFRTGDIVKQHKDDHIEYIGRKDKQVKVNGCRVDTFEIAEVLEYHKAIKDAIVTVAEKDGRNKIIAYYKVKKRYSVKPDQIRKFFENYFPDYMIPAFFIETNEFPLNYSLKTDLHQMLEDFSSLTRVRDQLLENKEVHI